MLCRFAHLIKYSPLVGEASGPHYQVDLVLMHGQWSRHMVLAEQLLPSINRVVVLVSFPSLLAKHRVAPINFFTCSQQSVIKYA